MKLTNVYEKFTLPVVTVLPKQFTFTREVNDKCNQYVKDPTESLLNEIQTDLGEEVVNTLKELGVNLPNDKVEFTVSLGSFLFDLYAHAATPPTAPLARAMHNSQLIKKSDELVKEEFEIDEEFKRQAKKTLLESSLWDTLQVSAEFKIGEEKRYVALSSRVSGFFPNVFRAVMDLFPVE